MVQYILPYLATKMLLIVILLPDFVLTELYHRSIQKSTTHTRKEMKNITEEVVERM